MRRRRSLVSLALCGLLVGAISPLAATAHDGLHGEEGGHLLIDNLLSPPADLDPDGEGDWGKLELLGQVRVHDAAPDIIADVAVDPDGNYAYLANWGAEDCAGPETGGRTSPDAGVYVIDISDLAHPVEVGFIPMHQDTRPGEGMQVVHITTPSFTGDVLAVNEEACGKNFKAGFSLWDVTNPLKPKKLAANFGDRTIDGAKAKGGDANESHSVFIWDAGDHAYLVLQDEYESSDVDIFDITDPKHPTLLTELDLNDFGVNQPELGLTDSFLHDMIVKQVDGRWIMLLSYWDGGWVLLDVTDPAHPVYLDDTDYPVVDQLVPGITPPEGNGHQAEFTADNRFIIGTDEDFAPYRLQVHTDDGGTFLAKAATQTTTDEAEGISGTTVFVGDACPGSTVPAGLPGDTIAVVERGICLFEEKVASVLAAGGYEAVIIMNRVGPDACKNAFEPFLEDETLPVIFVGRETGFALFDREADFDLAACLAGAAGDFWDLPVGTIGDTVTSVSSQFDGWGYVRLFDANGLAELDQYAVPEALSPDYATGFGDLSVHEVAADPLRNDTAYLSYYNAGARAVQIQCPTPGTTAGCQLVEVGGFIGPEGNDFWGVETFVRNGETIILMSDRDYGLFIFMDP
ncbi:MAG: hypothetical protein H0U52_02155 [Chloroflexi bacterium]|nr:hypothetical protein [Chloroflexota bacterium]